MWVQEGHDCKENGSFASHNTSLFSTIYSISNSRSKQSVTTIGIPMTAVSTTRLENKKSAPDMDVIPEEKDKELSESPKLRSTTLTPISPAQFLENMERKEAPKDDDNNGKDDVPMFTIDDINEDEESNTEEKHDINEAKNDEMWDLAIIGKKLNYPSVTPDAFDESDDDHSMDDNQEYKEEKTFTIDIIDTIDTIDDIDDASNEYYIPKQFEGLDIERAVEWQQCVDLSKNNGLLIVELYSAMFGASDVMYPFIDDILHNEENDTIQFIRLRINKMSEMHEIRDIIGDNKCYDPTPIPMYIFIKNGMKVDELKGTQPREFEELIHKHLQNEPQRPQTAPIKYSSILTQRPKSSYSYTTSPTNNKENRSTNTNRIQTVENIRNLIKDLDIEQPQTTRLSKYASDDSIRSTTQQQTDWLR